MSITPIAVLGALLLLETPAAPAGDTPAAAEKAAETTVVHVSPLQAREVIEKLKTLRAQILLDEEYNRLLEVRVKRLELEQQLESGDVSKNPSAPADKVAKKEKSPAAAARIANLPPPPSLDSSGAQLAVKSVTVSPFKEAMVVYKGRLYTVRPGDDLGGMKIRDITENGVVTNSSSVNLEQ